MHSIITEYKAVHSSIRNFRKKIANLAAEKRRQVWVFPNGEQVKAQTYYLQADSQRLVIGLPSRWQNRVPHLFCLDPEREPLSPDVEINIPLNPDRRVSGVYVREQNEVWLCTRGDFTAFRGKIPRKTALHHFEKWLVSLDDAGQSRQVIPVASLGSGSLTKDIVAFVRAVIDLKSKFKAGGAAKVAAATRWRAGKESEGTKKGKRTSAEFEYEYLHGPLCNALQTALSNLPGAGSDFVVRRNKQVDVAIVQKAKPLAIFEVKTSASLNKQLYSAIGQLLYYRQKYGESGTKLFLVLPSIAVSHGFPYSKFFACLGVFVLFGDGRSFKSSDGRMLRKLLEDVGCVKMRSSGHKLPRAR